MINLIITPLEEQKVKYRACMGELLGSILPHSIAYVHDKKLKEMRCGDLPLYTNDDIRPPFTLLLFFSLLSLMFS
jgi:hypothetical protein